MTIFVKNAIGKKTADIQLSMRGDNKLLVVLIIKLKD